MKLIFATANAHKLREAAEILGSRFEVISPASIGIFDDVEENGETLKENSLIKARHLFALTHDCCFADDTGLEVDALGGAPGVYSARYAGEGHDNNANMAKLLGELEKLTASDPSTPRTARFKTVVTLILDGEEHIFEGTMEGSIAFGRSGAGGFGYDPIFIPAAEEQALIGLTLAEGQTVADLSDEQKNIISHRGKAIAKMAEFLAMRYS